MCSYYGFVPRVDPRLCEKELLAGHPLRLAGGSEPSGSRLGRLVEKANHQVHTTTREVPFERLVQERLLGIDEQPAYDTSYTEDRRVAKDCTPITHNNQWFFISY